MQKPRVLIIGQSFNNDTGGGVTLSNLFRGWPKSKLAVICSGYELDHQTNLNICDNYYQLGWKEHKWIFPLNLIRRKYTSGRVIFNNKNKYQKIEIRKSKWRLNLIKNIFIPLIEFTGISHFASRLNLSPTMQQWLDDFSPDIIYMQASSLPDIKFCLLMQGYLNKPIIFHMMDDWPSIIPGSGPFGGFWSKQVDVNLRDIFNKSTCLLSICSDMSNAYLEKYGHSFKPFHNPIDLDFWSKHQRHSYHLPKEPKILYAGRTGLGIDTSLILVAKAITHINYQYKTLITLVLQTANKPHWIKNFPCVVFRPQVPYDQLPAAFAKADFLLLPYDFSKKAIKYIQYSMPTKASEFMSSGTPIIALGPAQSAVIKYAKKHNWAKVITNNKVAQIARAIHHLVENESERESIATMATYMARQNHDIQEVAPLFQNILIDTISANASVEKSRIKEIDQALYI